MSGTSVRSWTTLAVLVLLAPLALASAVRSQPPPAAPPTFELPEIEVAGKRPQLPSTTPAAVSVITADEIAAMGALTVADALRVLPEIRIKDSGGSGSLTTVSIRGSASTQVLILLDGIPVNRASLPSVDLSTFPIQNVDRIEVLRGPFSAIYGSGALGGVINIVTRTVPQTRISSRAGAFGESANSVSFGGAVGDLTYLLQGIITGSTGFAPDTDYSNSTVMTKLRWATAEDAAVTFSFNRLWHVVGSPGPLGLFFDPLARTWEGRTLLDLNWRSGRPDGPGAMFRLYTLDDDVAFSSPGSAFQSDNVDHLWGAQGQEVLTPWPGHLLTLGAEYQSQVVAYADNVPETFTNTGGDLGLYIQDDWQIGRGALLSVGVREDIFANYGTQVNPRLGIVVLLGDRVTLRAGAGRTFRPPSFDDLYFPGANNPKLQPETAWSYDLGLEYALALGLALHLTGFYTDATSLITFTSPCPTNPAIFGCPVNIGHAVVTGGSIELVGKPADRWFVRANYTNQLARDAVSERDVIYVPRHLANLELTYQLAQGSSLNVIVSYVGDRFANASNTLLVPGYWLTAFTATWNAGSGVTIQAGIANAFDVPYQESLGFPEPGRRFFATVTMSF